MGKFSVFFFLILLLNVYAEEQVGKKVEAESRGLKNMLSKLREWRERQGGPATERCGAGAPVRAG